MRHLDGTPLTGISDATFKVSSYRDLDGAGSSAIAGTFSEGGGGQYDLHLAAADLDADDIGLFICVSDAILVNIHINTAYPSVIDDIYTELHAALHPTPIFPVGPSAIPTFPDPLTVTHHSKGLNVDYTVTGAGKTPYNQKEQHPSLGVYTSYRVRFDYPYTIGFIPLPADTIDDGTTIWTVTEVGSKSIYYIPVRCINLNLNPLLSDYADIYEPDISINAYNNVVNDEMLTHRAVMCRLQPITTEEIDWLAKRGLRGSFSLWTYLQDVIPFKSVIRISNQDYKIVSSINRDRIDELKCLFLEINP